MLLPFLAALAQAEPPAPPATPKVLFVTHSAGFTHDVVKRAQRAVLAHAERCFVEAAAPMFAVEATQDCAALRADRLADYAAVVFYTTGELPMDDADKQALVDWVARGGAFVGVHSATDTFYEFPPYQAMVGGVFDGHPWHEAVTIEVEDRTHPTTFHLGEAFTITDEIYQFRSWQRDAVHVLLRLSAKGVDLDKGKRADRDYALSWCRTHGEGRVFYTALGHRPEVWRDIRFLSHLVAGLRWAVDRDGRLGRPPEGATVLLGPGIDRLRALDGGDHGWEATSDGTLRALPGAGDLRSEPRFGSARVHVEFKVARDAERGNSGVYLQRRYEVQILDSHGEAPDPRGCGALYAVRAPDLAAGLPAGEWQTFDIWFTAATFDGDRKTANARVTVVHNGIVVHRDVELAARTGRGIPEGPDPQPLVLQEHGSRIEFRNVWVLPLD